MNYKRINPEPSIAKKRSLGFATFVKMPWSKVKSEDYNLTYSWTGTELLVPEYRSGGEICHEVCHWLVCPVERRSEPEYGLGTAPYRDSLAIISTAKYKQDYEERTCLLQLYLYKISGLAWRSLAHFFGFQELTPRMSFDLLVSHESNKFGWEYLKSLNLLTVVENWRKQQSVDGRKIK